MIQSEPAMDQCKNQHVKSERQRIVGVVWGRCEVREEDQVRADLCDRECNQRRRNCRPPTRFITDSFGDGVKCRDFNPFQGVWRVSLVGRSMPT